MTERLIRAGDYRLSVRVAGDGSPPVVCLSSAGGAHDQWDAFVALLAERTTVITYGRPGLGGSDPLTPEESEVRRTGGWQAGQLRTLLAAAGVSPPVVLVTGSIAAFIADQYAATWPDEVAGMVLIDPSPLRRFPGVTKDRDDVLDTGGPGGTRLSWERSFEEQQTHAPANLAGRFVVLSSAVDRWLRNEPAEWHQPLSLAEVDAHWIVMQREWVARLDAKQVVADSAGHLVHREAPPLAAAVALEVVAAAREQRPVMLDQAGLAAVCGQIAVPHIGGG